MRTIKQPDDWGMLTHIPTELICPGCGCRLSKTSKGLHCIDTKDRSCGLWFALPDLPQEATSAPCDVQKGEDDGSTGMR